MPRPLMLRKYPYTTLLIGAGCLTALLLSLQLPFLYYSDDVVFHAAKMMAARDGDFFTDPVTGFESLYPPLFHIIWGTLARVFDLNSFQLSRVVQVVQYVGLLLSSFAFLRVVCGSRERAAWGTLCIILLMYAPTGKGWLFQNPSNTSVPFMLGGAALMMRFFQSRRRITGTAGAVLLAVGVNLWWYNLCPAAALFLGMFLSSWRQKTTGALLREWSPVVISFLLPLSFTAGVFFHLRAILPDYAGHTDRIAYSASHSTGRTIRVWLEYFLLKGNNRFFKYMYPAAWVSHSMMARIYGLAAAIYFYMLVLPVHGLVLVTAVRSAIEGWRRRAASLHGPLIIAAITTCLLSLVLMFLTNASIVYRVQWYVVLFLYPVFVQIVWDSSAGKTWRFLRRALPVIGVLAFFYSVVYRSELTLANPVTPETEAVSQYIGSIPGHADRRFFVSEFDNHRLLREVRYRSFLLTGNPTYYSQDNRRADSIESAYEAIVRGGPEATRALQEFQTEYAVIGKIPFNISPSKSTPVLDSLSKPMLTYFRARAELLFENDEWAVFRLPSAGDSSDDFVRGREATR